MRRVKTKSVHSAIDARKDGLRILATRLRGRGLKKNKYHLWMANLGPSEELLKKYKTRHLTWAEFSKRYKAELRFSPTFDRHNSNIKNHGQKFTLRLLQLLAKRGNVTVMCHCDEAETRCHRHVLAKLLAGKIS